MTLFGMEWYWWAVIVAALLIVIPLKVKFIKWWDKHQRENWKQKRGKWGDEE